MSPLPKERVCPAPVWSSVAIDLFGPLEHSDMVRRRLKGKCWGVLITCLVSRAVYIDLTQSYETDSFLQTFRRFISLNGIPKVVVTDRGSQLVAANKELQIAFEMINWNVVQGWTVHKGIEWRFVPVGGQHMNACAESLIKITKKILSEVLHSKRVDFVELQTILFEVAQILNSRPIGWNNRPNEDPLNGVALTPNHLLLGRATASIPEVKFKNVTLVRRLAFITETIDQF